MRKKSAHIRRGQLLSVALLMGVFALPAQAIVSGSGVDANTSASAWSGVVSISNDAGTFSGVLVGSNYAHGRPRDRQPHSGSS